MRVGYAYVGLHGGPIRPYIFVLYTISTQVKVKVKVKVKAFPYSIASVWPAADPGVQAVNPQVTVSHPSTRR